MRAYALLRRPFVDNPMILLKILADDLFYDNFIEKHDLLNRLKPNRMLLNVDALKELRMSKFEALLTLAEENKRKNQYQL